MNAPESLGNVLHGGITVCRQCGDALRLQSDKDDVNVVECIGCGAEYTVPKELSSGDGNPVAPETVAYPWRGPGESVSCSLDRAALRGELSRASNRKP